MITRFETLATVVPVHAYHGGPCPDFEVLVPRDTARVVAGGKMIARPRHGRLRVLFEADERGTALLTAPGRRLRFGLRLVNPYFANFTALPPQPVGSILLYRNAPDPRRLAVPETRQLVGGAFSHTLKGGGRPVAVSVTRAGLGAVKTEDVGPGRSSVAFDLTGLEPGAIAVEEAHPGAALVTPYYLDAELRPAGIFAVVEIAIDAGFYARPPTLEIGFLARQERLKYYLVASNYSAAEVGQLTVVDAGFAEQNRPEITFTRVLPSAFGPDDTPPEALAPAHASVLLFRSDAAVARRATPCRKIQLRRNAEPLIANLPQPGPASVTADLVIHLSKP